MSRYEGKDTLFVPTPSECQECGRQLKSKKKYQFVGVAKLKKGHWTLKKKCKKCGHINVAEHGRD